MRVVIVDNALHMEPERDQDRSVLDRLESGFTLSGFGREPTGPLLHVQVPLVPVDSIRLARPLDGLPPSGGRDAH